jgi:hypothetical protein
VAQVALVTELKCAYSVLKGKPEGKRLLGKTERRRDDNIRVLSGTFLPLVSVSSPSHRRSPLFYCYYVNTS